MGGRQALFDVHMHHISQYAAAAFPSLAWHLGMGLRFLLAGCLAFLVLNLWASGTRYPGAWRQIV
jgi:hypothetical protein